jgi:hypothetical protein
VLFDGSRVQGFFALRSGSVTLTRRSRHRLGQHIPPNVGASIMPWAASHKDAEPGTSRSVLLYALSIALEVARLQGTMVFVVEPDPESVAVYSEHYGFRWDAAKERLWVPLHAEEPQNVRK